MNEMANHGFEALGMIFRFMPLLLIPLLGIILVPSLDGLAAFKSDTWNPDQVSQNVLKGMFLIVVPPIIVPVELWAAGYVWVISIALGFGFTFLVRGLDYAKKAPVHASVALRTFKQRSLLVGLLALAICSIPAVISVVK